MLAAELERTRKRLLSLEMRVQSGGIITNYSSNSNNNSNSNSHRKSSSSLVRGSSSISAADQPATADTSRITASSANADAYTSAEDGPSGRHSQQLMQGVSR